MLSHILQPRVDPNTIHRPQLMRRPYSSPAAGQAPVLITISSDKTATEPMNLNFAPSGLLSAMSIPITARGLGSLAVRAFSGKQAQHAAFIAFYRKCGSPD
jgi:hypothetical protein